MARLNDELRRRKKADENQLHQTVRNTLRKLSRPTNKNCLTADHRLDTPPTRRRNILIAIGLMRPLLVLKKLMERERGEKGQEELLEVACSSLPLKQGCQIRPGSG
ncbi:hypothetical protein DPX16_15806 [Anabarilius grahami]|uniref:Uncharacterized protein n=1 Tax=Anabarilius grahami TaxID=495550 RepID=A0A3N0YU38_ANAGA|nr:hypothetical protein DPX16_15806 [Anabarilius grahami]